MAWINVDSTCRLHYQVRLNAGKKATEAKILLQDHPMQNLKVGVLTYTIVLQNSVVKGLCIIAQEKLELHTEKNCIKLTSVQIDSETMMYVSTYSYYTTGKNSS